MPAGSLVAYVTESRSRDSLNDLVFLIYNCPDLRNVEGL
jgi:hypothetical protein